MDNTLNKYTGFYCLNLADKCWLHEEEWNSERSNDVKFYIINSNNVDDAKDELFEVLYDNDLGVEKKDYMAYFAINWVRIQEEEEMIKIFGKEEAEKIIKIISLFPENKEEICMNLIPEKYLNLSQHTLKILTKIHVYSDLKIYKVTKELTKQTSFLNS